MSIQAVASNAIRKLLRRAIHAKNMEYHYHRTNDRAMILYWKSEQYHLYYRVEKLKVRFL